MCARVEGGVGDHRSGAHNVGAEQRGCAGDALINAQLMGVALCNAECCSRCV